MKRSLFAILTIAALGVSAQCLAAGGADCPTCKPGLFHRSAGSFFPFKKCSGCGKMCGPFHKCGLLHHHGRAEDMGYGFGGGPPVGQVTYPYYTVRGPRDFLDPNPRGIGP